MRYTITVLEFRYANDYISFIGTNGKIFVIMLYVQLVLRERMSNALEILIRYRVRLIINSFILAMSWTE